MAVDLIKQLRDDTGVSIMDCKRALEKANNDLELAKTILKEEGLAKADKKADRETKTGIIASYISDDNKSGAILELRCETDFVAKNDEFVKLNNDLTKEVSVQKPADVNDFLTKPMNGETVENVIKQTIAKFGEKMEIGQYDLLNVDNGFVTSYIHAGGKVGVLVSFNSPAEISLANENIKSFGKDICMQIAAMNPKYVNSNQIPAETMDFFKKEFESEVDMSKPEEIRTKILAGKFSKKFEEICLLNQKFIKDDSKTIESLLTTLNSQNSINLEISKFLRYQI